MSKFEFGIADSIHNQSIPYSFYDPNCQTCQPNHAPDNNNPPYQPVQVTREIQTPSNVENINKYVQQQIQNSNQNSIWQYYKLINVRWPKNSGPEPAGMGITIGQFKDAINRLQYSSSSQQVTSNTTMETYIQKADCLQCHQKTPIAASEKFGCIPAVNDSHLLDYPSSDFSFLLEEADTPDHYAAKNCKKVLRSLRVNFLQELAAPLK